jgi:deoxyribodipyrimidine photolyase-related protein
MKNLRIILYDQLSHEISSLSDIDKDEYIVLMVELHSEFIHVKHHKKKIAFLGASTSDLSKNEKKDIKRFILPLSISLIFYTFLEVLCSLQC